MNELSLEDLPAGEVGDWVDSIASYQAEVMHRLLSDSSPLDAAALWLEGGAADQTAPFGGVRVVARDFLTNILRELQKLFCLDDPAYSAARDEISANVKTGGKTLIVTAVSVSIAPYVGAAAVVIVPAVAIALAVIGNAGRQTGCQSLAELIREREDSPP